MLEYLVYLQKQAYIEEVGELYILSVRSVSVESDCQSSNGISIMNKNAMSHC